MQIRVKTKHRDTVDVVVGGLIGAWHRPASVVVGRYDTTGQLRIVARSAPLSAAAAAELADVLTPAGAGHPWPDTLASTRFGVERARLLRVDPVLVAEVAVDPAQDQGVWRHLARWGRVRPDLTVADVPVIQRRTA